MLKVRWIRNKFGTFFCSIYACMSMRCNTYALNAVLIKGDSIYYLPNHQRDQQPKATYLSLLLLIKLIVLQIESL